jgi:uncharacterized protein
LKLCFEGLRRHMPELRQLLSTAAARKALVLVAMALLALAPARAAEDDQGGSFLNPFPEGEIYQLTVMGDTFAEGLLTGLLEAMGPDARLNIQKKHREISGVMSADFESKIKEFEDGVAKDPLNIAIVMVGEDDRVPLKGTTSKKLVAIGTPEWRAEYARRIDRMMKALKRKNASVYWVGLPNLSRTEANEQAQGMNEVIRERAYINGFKYIDAFAGFIDEAGAYSAYGPDLTGKIRVLREGDGVHFTAAGNRKLAHFAEKDLRRDLNQAKADRVVPLLGAEAEQVKINPDNVAAVLPKSATAGPAAGGTAGAATAGQPDSQGIKIIRAEGPPGSPPSADPSGDQKADNGKITFKIAGASGREEMQTVEILRPAIPASVVALMARRETQGQAGDLLVDQIAGGLTLMSSITPAGNKSRGKLSPAQAPYFRLLVKGLTPKPGRADDTLWPVKGDAASDAGKAAPGPGPKG